MIVLDKNGRPLYIGDKVLCVNAKPGTFLVNGNIYEIVELDTFQHEHRIIIKSTLGSTAGPWYAHRFELIQANWQSVYNIAD
jgi:hypothetical protein